MAAPRATTTSISRARKLLDSLYAAGNIRTEVFSNYHDGSAVEAGDLLVSYTSQVPVADSACFAIRRFLEGGGRWFAIHASNSVRDNRLLPEIMGSRFIAHPTILIRKYKGRTRGLPDPP